MLGVKNTDLKACIASNGKPSFTSISGQNEPKSTEHKRKQQDSKNEEVS